MLRLGIQYTFSIRDTERHSRQTNYMHYYKMIFRDGRLYLEAGPYKPPLQWPSKRAISKNAFAEAAIVSSRL